MIVLGFDYGNAHIGIAKGETSTRLTESVRTVPNTPAGLSDIADIVTINKPSAFIVGVSEQLSAVQAKKFAQSLSSLFPNIPIHLADETLSTQEAAEKLSYLSAQKRQQREHAAAAAVILERWLDEQGADTV